MKSTKILGSFLLFSALLVSTLLAPGLAIPTSTADVARPNAIPTEVTTTNRRGEMPLEFFNYLKDCFVVNVQDGQQQYAAWLPLRTFLKMYAAGGGNSERLESKVSELKPYLMFMVENRTFDQYKNPVSESAESLRARTVLKLPNGEEVKPLDRTPEGMPQNPPSFGTLGRRGQMLIFQVGDSSADLDAEDTPRGSLQLILHGNDVFKESKFTWHLPLELAGTNSQCTRCHNDVSNKWSYCPWCGLKQTKKKKN